MQGEAQHSASGAGRGVLDRYGPGKRELTVFVALVFLGFVVCGHARLHVEGAWGGSAALGAGRSAPFSILRAGRVRRAGAW